MNNSSKAKHSMGKRTQRIKTFLCFFLIAVMLLPLIPEGALYVDALNNTFGPVTSATASVNGSYITGKPGVYIVGDGYVITWVTSFKGIGWLTYTKNGQEVTVYDERNGILRSFDAIHTVKVPEEDYQYLCNGYTVHSKEVTSHDYATTAYGVECSYTTKLKDTKPGVNEDVDILTLTDVHDTAARANNAFGNYKNYFNNISYDPNIVVFSGDVVSHLDETTLKQMFEIMGNSTYGQYPIVYCRGNHETRGIYSTKLLDYFPTKTGELYFDFTFGSLWGVVLDTGEDKPATHEAYGHLANFEVYLMKQENWLRTLRKPTDPNIKYRLGIYHMPRLETLARKVVFEDGTSSTPVETFFFGTDITDSLAHLDLQFGIAGHEHKYKIYDNAQLYSSAIEGMTEAEVLSYMMAGDVTYKYTATVNGMPARDFGGKEEYFKAGTKINFVPSSVKHKTFLAGGDWHGTAFVKLNAADGATGTATLYGLTVEGNEVEVNDDGTRNTSNTGKVFSSKSNPKKIDLYEPNRTTDPVIPDPVISETAYGEFNHFKPVDWKITGEYFTSGGYCTPSIASTGFAIDSVPAVFESGGDWYNVVWSTNTAAAGFVQLVYEGKTYQFFDEVSGKKRCEDRIHTVKVPKKFLNNNKYIVGNHIVTHQKGQLSYFKGHYSTSAEYVFEDRSNEKTPNVLVYGNYKNDMAIASTLAGKAIEGLSSDYSFIAATGDLCYISAGTNKATNPSPVAGNDACFRDIFEAASALSGGTKLIVFSRGNAECRGFYATELIKYIPTVTGEFYYAFNYGDQTFINLDTAEDRRDYDSTCGGRLKTDALYLRQDAWLDSVLNSEDLQESITVLSHAPLYNMDIVKDGNSNFSDLNLDWGKKLSQHGALLNLAGSNVVQEVVPIDKTPNTAERYMLTVVNGGLNYLSAKGTYNNYATAASVLIAKEQAYVTFSQVAEKDGTYSGPFYEPYTNTSTKNIATYLAHGQKAYTLETGAEISYTATAPSYKTDSATGGKIYTISTPSHLAWMAQQVAAKNHFEKDTFVLANDIDLMLYPFTPIGGFDITVDEEYGDHVYSGDLYFSGAFDGKGHKITNINIVPKDTNGKFVYKQFANNRYNGLFGVIRNGSVKNLVLEGGYVKGDWYTGALAGYVDSTTTTPATITNCYTNVTVYAPGGLNNGKYWGASKVGGVIGHIAYNVTIDQCANYGNVKTTRYNGTCGGIVGEAFCYNNASTTAGTTGLGTFKILNCFNRGNLFNVNGYSAGIVGNINQANGTIENCYNAASVWGAKNAAILGTAARTNGGSLTIHRCFFAETIPGAAKAIYTPASGAYVLTYVSTFQLKLEYNEFSYDSKVANAACNTTQFLKSSRKTAAGMTRATYLNYLNTDTTDNGVDTANKFMKPPVSDVLYLANDGFPIHSTILSFPSVANQYTVTFVGKDGTVLKTETVIENGAATAPTAPDVDGFKFIGWDIAFDKVTSDLTVTAKYEELPKEYTVIFVSKDGKILKAQTVIEGGAATAPVAPAVEGFVFVCWDKAFDNVTSDLTVTAKYEPLIKEYTVIFVSKDGKILKAQTVVEGGAATAPAAPVVEGFTFIGWDKAFDNITGDLTVTALYEEIPVISNDFFTFEDNADNTNVSIDDTNDYLVFSAGGMTIANIKALFVDTDLVIKSATGTEKTSGRAGTGCTITSTINGETKTLTVVVKGDIDGNGSVMSADYTKLAASISSGVALEGCYKAAADVQTPYNTVNSRDVIKLSAYIAKSIENF